MRIDPHGGEATGFRVTPRRCQGLISDWATIIVGTWQATVRIAADSSASLPDGDDDGHDGPPIDVWHQLCSSRPLGIAAVAYSDPMSVVIRVDVDDEHARLVPTGSFELAHGAEIARAVAGAERDLDGRRDVILDLSSLERIDGSGAVLLAGLIDRLEARGLGTRCIEAHNPHAARLIALYRGHRTEVPAEATRTMGPFARLGAAAAGLPATLNGALDFVGHSAAAIPGALVSPRSVDWKSLPRLMQAIGADALPVTSAANLLIGLIIGFLGVSQLGRFGAAVYVPELVVIAQFRELGPLVTAIVVAGRSGAGLASELATMRVSEEIDALQSMGFDPVRWLVVPRCLALILTMPLLTWIGDVLALGGGLLATIVISDLTPRAYILGTSAAITGSHFLTGMVKTPFLALAIGLIACGQGLAARGGASAVGARTTAAVVLAIFGVIVISALFTLFFTLLGI
jgi:phospholipid/cholesterol/gamma-HCH transport system permease protein